MTPIGVIALAELFGTSLWFSANSVMPSLQQAWHLSTGDVGLLTNAVQLGFVAGTMAIGLTGFADRYRSSRIFVVASVLGAVANAAFAVVADSFWQAAVLRLVVGLSLAGIYPLGMKLVIGWTRDGHTGGSLGVLVGMLTLGTAVPHAVRWLATDLPWHEVVLVSSVLALVGAGMVLRLGDGPRTLAPLPRRTRGWSVGLQAFRVPEFRAGALGYFGHMWELYAFWTVVPMLAAAALDGIGNRAGEAGVSALSFAVVGVGALSCLAGGALSRRIGSARVAAFALACSGAMCVVYPWASQQASGWAIAVLLIWGLGVVADSPQFSSVCGNACPAPLLGSALAMMNSIGFLITMLSISMATTLYPIIGPRVSWLLAAGPALGLLAMRPLFLARQRHGATRHHGSPPSNPSPPCL